MRIALLSDIHANHEALRAVLNDLDEQRITRAYCLGDTVGYGASPNPCCDLVRSRFHGCVLGNHDAALTGREDLTCFRPAARHALLAHLNTLSEPNREWLSGLDYELELERFDVHLCHGSPLGPELFGYLFERWHALECLPMFGQLAHLTLVGHTHLTRAFELTTNTAWEMPATSFELRPDRKYICSVGSVGQPRDFDPRASYAVYDTSAQRLEYRRVEYDNETAAEKILAANLSRDNAVRLLAGSRLSHARRNALRAPGGWNRPNFFSQNGAAHAN